MANEKSTKEIIEGVESFINNLHAVGYGPNAIQSSKIEGYGSGQSSFNQMRDDFGDLDLSLNIESSELKKQNANLKKEVADLEQRYTDLNAIFGSEEELKKGSVAYDIVSKIQKEIDDLIKKRDDLINQVKVAQENFETQFAGFNQKANDAEEAANDRITVAKTNADEKVASVEREANRKVKLIFQFKDFLSETNKNMSLYFWVILGVLVTALVAVGCSIPKLMGTFDSYDTYVNGLLNNKTPWQILNFAFGILIVKLPWALCLSAVLTGMYKLLKGLLHTYEKINQDKRNMSAIYAVSDNVAKSLNEYGLAISNELEWEESDSEDSNEIILKISKTDLVNKRENLKWNQIMNYFERMQTHKEEPEEKEDDSKLKLATDLLNKVIDKFPSKG